MSQPLEIPTRGRGFYRLDDPVNAWLATHAAAMTGLLHLFIRHTSASLLITEAADPDVLVDLERWMADAVRDGDARFRHQAEGPDDMPAHIRSVLTASFVTVPFDHGRLDLGTWQGIFLWEHRARPHQRRIALTVVPTASP